VTPPPDPGTVKVGVLLAQRPGELGEWLADAAAFEAAGAHALWVDPAPESKLDPLALLAALAAVTSRALLVATPPASEYPSEALGLTLATIGRLSHARLALAAEPGTHRPGARLRRLPPPARGAGGLRAPGCVGSGRALGPDPTTRGSRGLADGPGRRRRERFRRAAGPGWPAAAGHPAQSQRPRRPPGSPARPRLSVKGARTC
jgi:hypothetical protein